MNQFKPYSRRRLTELRRHWIRRNVLPLAGAASFFVLGSVLATFFLLIPGEPGPWRWYLVGAMHAATVAVFLSVVQGAFLTHEREAIQQVRGAWGEENTREELKRARRRRLVWGWVDSIELKAGDIDHLVVTRRGGLLAIDSKWRTDPSPSSGHVDQMAEEALRAARRAEWVAGSLLRKEPGGHRARVSAQRVRPVVVIWGKAQSQLPAGYSAHGVPFVRGREFLKWLRTVEGETVTRAAARDLVTRLGDFRATARQ